MHVLLYVFYPPRVCYLELEMLLEYAAKLLLGEAKAKI